MNSKREMRTFEEYLVERLKDQENAQGFLTVILEEYTHGRDLKALLNSLDSIAAAKGGAFQLVENSEVDQLGLDRLLAEDSNPEWESVIEALGYTFSAGLKGI